MAFNKEEQLLISILQKNKVTYNAPKMFKVGDQGRKMYFTAIIPNIVIEKNKETPKSLLIHLEEKLPDKREETLRDHTTMMKETYTYAKDNNYCLLGLVYTDGEGRMSEVISDMLQLINKGEEKGPITRISSSSLAALVGLSETSVLVSKQKKTVKIIDNKEICLETDPVPPIIPIPQENKDITKPIPTPTKVDTAKDTPTQPSTQQVKSGICIVS